jgi:DeoR/GlpR family transcriptional regulator of sugar metabolism
MTGGRFSPESGLLLGPGAINNIAAYHADIAILSVRGIDGNGLYNHNEEIAEIGRTMIENADHVIIIADHSKIGRCAMNKVASCDRIEALFTMETAENSNTLNEILTAGVKVFSEHPINWN